MVTNLDRKTNEGSVLKDRYTAKDIFERIIKAANEEVRKGSKKLFFSGIAAGFAITLTFFLYATMTHESGGDLLISSLLYPLGFIYIILGGYQLYTENTLPPVALVIERLTSLPSLFYVWGVVLAGNLIGSAIGAFGLASFPILSAGAAEAAIEISSKVLEKDWWRIFFHGSIAGFIVAGLVWLDYAARDTTTRFFQVYIAFFAISIASLNHSIVTAVESFYLLLLGNITISTAFSEMLLPVFLGNTLGGVFLVTIVNYFMTPDIINKNESIRLKWKDWLSKFRIFSK
ncbi:MAG: formate/nitrite transporter family protein [Candidatus Pacearchaeota archaeon]